MRWGALLSSALLCVAGCGGDDGDPPRLVVSAAASMTAALTRCSPAFEGADVRLSFAGSGELAAQIRRGLRPDLFAAANIALPRQLRADGLLEPPVRFATNELVVAVPAGSPVRSLDDLGEDGVAIAVGSRAAPVGDYTREALASVPRGLRRRILANVRSREPDANGIVGKLTQGAVDAGFVYRSDVAAAGGELRSVALPPELRPAVAYAGAVVAGARNPEAARRFLDGLVRGDCRRALTAAGFGPPR